MRNPERIDKILEKIREVWHRNPDLRLGQLVSVVTTLDHVWPEGSDIFFIEDDVFLKKLGKFNDELKRRQELLAEEGE